MLMLHQDARLLHGKDSVQRARNGFQRLIDSAATPGARSGTGMAPRKAAAPRRKAAGHAPRNRH
jgi:hypothetical protein